MDLWTDFEGKTIAGAYRLAKLLRSEGRNGFFSTTNGKGAPAVIRLTEAHFDEAEQLERWRHVAQIEQENLITIDRVGQTDVDGLTLTYAVMEPEDGNLEEVLKERPLTSAETMQVARGVGAALLALHDSGLVHQHVEPANVLAVGEVVKLRSDCVREGVENEEFDTPQRREELRRNDVHDFGVLLLRCLTLEREWSETLRLPEPFRQVIPHALDGSWTLQQILAVLHPVALPVAAVPTTQAESPALPTPASRVARAAVPGVAATIPVRASRAWEAPEETGTPFKVRWLAYAVAAVLALALIWHLSGSSKPAPQAGNVSAPAAAPAPRAALPGPAETAERTPEVETERAVPLAEHRAGWYVVAFTYNREDQARAKATRLARRHASLHPQVFSPTGHAPYLVSLGGAMSEAEASGVLRHAHRAGLPRDTFMRRY